MNIKLSIDQAIWWCIQARIDKVYNTPPEPKEYCTILLIRAAMREKNKPIPEG